MKNMDPSVIEERFTTAVEIIKSLPKTGSVQTSNETKLKFYSYFKQATEGPCELSKPGFWDVVNRAKWDAWHRLGNMSKEEAMRNYVQEFVKVIQATPFDSLDDPTVVNEFMGLMGPYIEFAPEELRMKHMLMNGKANKPLNNNSEDYVEEYGRSSRSPTCTKDFNNKMSDDGSDLYSSPVNGHSLNGGNESDSDVFSDTLEGDDPEETSENNNTVNNNPVAQCKGPNIINVRGGDHRLGTGNGNSMAGSSSGRGSQPIRQGTGSNWVQQASSNNNMLGSAGGSRRSEGGLPTEISSDVNEQLALAVIRLQHIMEQVVVRLDSLETLLTQRSTSNPSMQVSSKNYSRWSIFGMSPKLAVLIFAWPFIVQFLMYYIRKRQRRL